MPAFGAVQTPTALSNGDSVAVLNAENLSSGALTMAVALTPQPTPVTLAIYNNSSQTVDLVASPDLTSGDYLPVYEGETAITVATATVGVFQVASGLYYAVKAAGAITAGTIWLAR
jgi:predicted RecA/RadA family phage recombinase